MPRSTQSETSQPEIVTCNIPTFKLPRSLPLQGVSVVPGFNVPYNRPPNEGDEQNLYWNFENDEYEPYNSDADAAGCYLVPEDEEDCDEEGEGDDSEQEGDEEDDDEEDECENTINCPHHCHCDGPGYVCFSCRLEAMNLKVEMPRARSLPPPLTGIHSIPNVPWTPIKEWNCTSSLLPTIHPLDCIFKKYAQEPKIDIPLLDEKKDSQSLP